MHLICCPGNSEAVAVLEGFCESSSSQLLLVAQQSYAYQFSCLFSQLCKVYHDSAECKEKEMTQASFISPQRHCSHSLLLLLFGGHDPVCELSQHGCYSLYWAKLCTRKVHLIKTEDIIPWRPTSLYFNLIL